LYHGAAWSQSWTQNGSTVDNIGTARIDCDLIFVHRMGDHDQKRRPTTTTRLGAAVTVLAAAGVAVSLPVFAGGTYLASGAADFQGLGWSVAGSGQATWRIRKLQEPRTASMPRPPGS
jgi:hypothetical protein